MINFPENPNNDDTYSYMGIAYIYKDPPGIWVIYESQEVEPIITDHTVYVNAVAPENPSNGRLWYDTVNGILFLWVDDGLSSQWIQV